MVTHPNKDQCLGVPDLVFPLPDFDYGKLNRASTSTRQPFHLEKEIKIINDVSLVYISLQKQAALFFFTVRVSFTKLNKWESKLGHVQILILNKRTEGSDKKWRGQLSLTLNTFSFNKKIKGSFFFFKEWRRQPPPPIVRHDRSTFINNTRCEELELSLFQLWIKWHTSASVMTLWRTMTLVYFMTYRFRSFPKFKRAITI